MPRGKAERIPPLRSSEVARVRPSRGKYAAGISRPYREEKGSSKRGGAAAHGRGPNGVGGGKQCVRISRICRKKGARGNYSKAYGCVSNTED